MHTHLLTPLAPLVLRIGKPFGETGGGESFPFPLPSTVAGALRTARADALALDFKREQTRLLAWSVQGPLPAQMWGKVVEPLLPRPLDAYYARCEFGKCLLLSRMAPATEPLDGKAEGCDLPDGLLPVMLETADKSKPAHGPAWWNQAAMDHWLSGQIPDPGDLGPHPLPIETRTHVALDPNTLAASTGLLFQSAGPDFDHRRLPNQADMTQRSWSEQRYALAVRFAEKLDPTLLRLGGESRLSAVEACGSAWPTPSPALLTALNQASRIRLILATPALFHHGWRPGWIGDGLTGAPPGLPGLRLKLRAAAVERWQAVSGWDLAANRPKAVRRLAPVGSVYWFEVLESPAGWAEKLWLQPISDGDQDRRDGFGLALPGLWQ